MPDTLVTSPTSFTVSRTIDATREKVFDAWTKPEILQQWWGPPGHTSPSAVVDLRPGGKYRIGMKGPEGDVFYLTGTFVEIRRPEKLVYTWAWEEEQGPGHESQVTIEFHASGEKTDVVVTHERLDGAESRDRHIQGWVGCLDKLVALLG